ncbi:MAG TPA: hypothetical protein VN675_14270 [Burkholderiales bacterium]|nr:hypothetical protein [Burkholderiales bacterium]
MNGVCGPREELIQLLYLHGDVSARWLAGEADLAGARARLAAWVTQQLRQRLHVKDERAVSEWRALAGEVRARELTPQQCSARHATVIGRLVEATRPGRERRAA